MKGQSANQQIERRKGNFADSGTVSGCESVRDENRRELVARWKPLRPDGRLVERTPGQIHGIIGQNDEMALGAIQALKAAGLDQEYGIAGIDVVTIAMLAVKAGETVSILQDTKAQAQGALDLALRALIGDEYKPQADCWTQCADGSLRGDKLSQSIMALDTNYA